MFGGRPDNALSRNAGFAKGVFSSPAILYSAKTPPSARSVGDGDASVVSSHDGYELEVKGALLLNAS